MTVNTTQLVELAPGESPPLGVVELPPELQPAARSLMAWAIATSSSQKRARRKAERQNRRKGRAHQ